MKFWPESIFRSGEISGKEYGNQVNWWGSGWGLHKRDSGQYVQNKWPKIYRIETNWPQRHRMENNGVLKYKE